MSGRKMRACELCGHRWHLKNGGPEHPRCFTCRQTRCGTTGGYWKHLTQGQKPCPDCQAAHDQRREAIATGQPVQTRAARTKHSGWSDAAIRYHGQWIPNGRGILIPTITGGDDR